MHDLNEHPLYTNLVSNTSPEYPPLIRFIEFKISDPLTTSQTVAIQIEDIIQSNYSTINLLMKVLEYKIYL